MCFGFQQKRKVSAYNLWSSKMRKQVATQYPGLQFGEVSRKLGNLWKKIPEKERQVCKKLLYIMYVMDLGTYLYVFTALTGHCFPF